MEISHEQQRVYDPMTYAKQYAAESTARTLGMGMIGPMAKQLEDRGIPPEIIEQLKNIPSSGGYSAVAQIVATNPQLENVIGAGFLQGQQRMQQNAFAMTATPPSVIAADPVGAASTAFVRATDISNEMYMQSRTTNQGQMSAVMNTAKTGGLNMGEMQDLAVKLGSQGAGSMVPGAQGAEHVSISNINAPIQKVSKAVMSHARAAKAMMDAFGSQDWKQALEDYQAVTGNTSFSGGTAQQMAFESDTIAARSESLGMDSRTGAKIYAQARSSAAYATYGEDAKSMGMLFGTGSEGIGRSAQGLTERWASKNGVTDPALREAMGGMMTKSLVGASASTGGRALEVFNMLRAGGKVDEATSLAAEDALKTGDTAEFTKIMGRVSQENFGTTAAVQRLATDPKAFATYKAQVTKGWMEEGKDVHATRTAQFNNLTTATLRTAMAAETRKDLVEAGGERAMGAYYDLAGDYSSELSAEDRTEADKSAMKSVTKTLDTEIADLKQKASKGDKSAKAKADELLEQKYVLESKWEKTGDIGDAIGALDDTGMGALVKSRVQTAQARARTDKMVETSGTMKYGIKGEDIERMESQVKLTAEEEKAYGGLKTPEEKAAFFNDKMANMLDSDKEQDRVYARKKINLFKEQKDGITKTAKALGQTDVSNALTYAEQGYGAAEATGRDIAAKESDETLAVHGAATQALTVGKLTKRGISAAGGVLKQLVTDAGDVKSMDPAGIQNLITEAQNETFGKVMSEAMATPLEITGTFTMEMSDGTTKEVKLNHGKAKRKKK